MPLDPTQYDSRTPIGMAALSRLAYEGGDLNPVFQALVQRATADPADAAALMDLSTILQITGQREQGLAIQGQALAITPHFRRAGDGAKGLRVLAMMLAGDFMANTPIEFLLEGAPVRLEFLYLDAAGRWQDLPEHDVLFLAVGESPESQ